MAARGRAPFRLAILLLAVALLLSAAPALARAADVGITLSATRTDAQVRELWTQLKPAYLGAPYAVAPSVKAPYAPGTVNSGFLADGLGIINFARFLAGVPHDVTLDGTLNETSQYGAVLLAASTFSHSPPKPGDMLQTFYDRGLASTSSSNIGWGDVDSESFQLNCLADSDSGNIAAIGHRRWLLNPQMLRTGIGFAESRHTTYAFDRSRAEQVAYSVIAYPSAGPFPVDQGFFGADTPWSVTLNPARYDWDGTGHTVTLRRVADGKTWTFTASDTNTSGEFFSFNTGGYGVPNAFVFRPDPRSIAYNAGDEFDVTLWGGIYAEGTRTPASVSYRTRFIALAGSTGGDPGTGDLGTAVSRYAGDDRFGTAIRASQAAYVEGSCASIVLATGLNHPDALSAAGLAGAVGSPVLLVGGNTLRADIRDEIRRLVSGRSSYRIYLIGGAQAISTSLESSIKAALAGETVERVWGATRYETANAVARKAQVLLGGALSNRAFLVTGTDYVDGLLCGPASYRTHMPVLLVGTSPTQGLIDTLNALGTTELVVVGSTASVSSSVEAALKSARPAMTTRRVANSTDPYARSTLAAEWMVSNAGLAWSSAGVATGERYPDALCAGPVEGRAGGPLLLTRSASLPTVVAGTLTAHKASMLNVRIYGGPVAISSGVEATIRALLQ